MKKVVFDASKYCSVQKCDCTVNYGCTAARAIMEYLIKEGYTEREGLFSYNGELFSSKENTGMILLSIRRKSGKCYLRVHIGAEDEEQKVKDLERIIGNLKKVI